MYHNTCVLETHKLSGGISMQCPSCLGEGRHQVFEWQDRTPAERRTSYAKCHVCNGTGTVVRRVCFFCNRLMTGDDCPNRCNPVNDQSGDSFY